MAIIKLSSAKISARIGIDYICNKEKTLGKLISGKDCMPESCYGLMENIFEMLSNLPTIEENDDYYDGGIEDIELDKIIEKMRAHGLKITKAQIAHCRNEYDNQGQNQGFGWSM